MGNSSILEELIEAEEKANLLFQEIQVRNLIVPGITEKELNSRIFSLAEELFKIRKYWHKRIVRAGKNTLLPYAENPPDLVLREDEILFLDFGPVFEQWEADFGRTFVIGSSEKKLKLQRDVELAWSEGYNFFQQNYDRLTGAEFYDFTVKLAAQYGWQYGNEHCGHLVGRFPHEKILGETRVNYFHPENHELLSAPDILGAQRHWIYEIHFIDQELQIGGFYEQLLRM